MRTALRFGFLLLACLSLVCAPVALTGCASAQKTSYQVAASTQVSVDAAMNMWGAYVGAKHPPVAQERAVANAYAKYQAAMVVVCDAGKTISQAGANAPASTIEALMAGLKAAVANADQTIADLNVLLVQFGVNVKLTK